MKADVKKDILIRNHTIQKYNDYTIIFAYNKARNVIKRPKNNNIFKFLPSHPNRTNCIHYQTHPLPNKKIVS